MPRGTCPHEHVPKFTLAIHAPRDMPLRPSPSSPPRPHVRWLRLYARSDGDRTDLGHLALPPEPDPARDAAADAAAARIAARLNVPLERYDEAGERLS